MKSLSRSFIKEVPVSLSYAVLARIREFRKQLQNFLGPNRKPFSYENAVISPASSPLGILATPVRAECETAGSCWSLYTTHAPLLAPGTETCNRGKTINFYAYNQHIFTELMLSARNLPRNWRQPGERSRRGPCTRQSVKSNEKYRHR